MFSSRCCVSVRLMALTRSVLCLSPRAQSACANNFPRVDYRTVPKTLVEYNRLRSIDPVQPCSPKLLRVAVIGQPNVGRSTLVNILMRWKVCSVSSKVHTTRHNAKAVLVDGETQIVFLDTPGIIDIDHGRKHHLEASMIVDPEHALHNADLVAVMVDASDHWRRHSFDRETLRLLEFNPHLTSILIVNKVDLLKSKRQILEFTHSLTGGRAGGVPTCRFETVRRRLNPEELFSRTDEMLRMRGVNVKEESRELKSDDLVKQTHGDSKKSWPNFSRIFMISALKNGRVRDIRDFLLQSARPSEWMYPFEMVTDQNPHELATLIVREKILNHLSREVPCNVEAKISMWDLDAAGVLHIVIEILGKNTRHVKHILGEGGKTVKAIASESRQDIAAAFRSDVSLKLVVKNTNVG